MKVLTIRTSQKRQVVDLTEEVNELIAQSGVKYGVCQLFVKHTTCCLTTGEVGEGTDEDLLEVAENMIPKINFRHAHNPAHAWTHMASSIIGSSLSLPIEQGALELGTWQSPILLELDGPRERKIVVKLVHGQE